MLEKRCLDWTPAWRSRHVSRLLHCIWRNIKSISRFKFASTNSEMHPHRVQKQTVNIKDRNTRNRKELCFALMHLMRILWKKREDVMSLEWNLVSCSYSIPFSPLFTMFSCFSLHNSFLITNDNLILVKVSGLREHMILLQTIDLLLHLFHLSFKSQGMKQQESFDLSATVTLLSVSPSFFIRSAWICTPFDWKYSKSSFGSWYAWV